MDIASQEAKELKKLKEKYKDLEKRLYFIEKASINLELFEHTLNSISDCLIITDMDDQIIFVNKITSETYGYTSDELIGKPITFLRSEKNPPQNVKDIYVKTITDGWEGEIYNQRKDGSDFLIHLRTSLVKDDEEKPIAMVGVARDLTEETKAKEVLKIAQDKYRSLFMEIPDVVYESTPSGELIDINPSGVELFGFDSKEELLKLDIANDLYVNPEDRKRYKEILERNGFAKNYEITIKTKNGRPITILETASIVRNAKGDVTSYRGIMRDISEIKTAEEQIRKHLGEIAIANKQLHESEIELKELNESKDKFFSIIAHDLRSPFTSLVGLSEFLAEDLDDLTPDEIRVYSSEINKSSKNILKLLENLLQWARIQTGRMEYDPEFLQLFPVVDDCIKLLLNNATNKQIELVNSVHFRERVYADEHMITSVIQNLISNAIKFTGEGGQIIIRSQDKGEFVEISVSDSGVGMTDTEVLNLFKIETMRSTPGTDDEQGTGLGLILCKELINKNAGDVTCTSKIGEGTTFLFTLPKNSTK